MKVSIFGSDDGSIRNLAEKLGFDFDEKKPELVVSYGGDGTLVRAEYHFPGVPKVLLKNSAICKKCQNLPNDEILKKVAEGKYAIEELWKLEAVAKGKTLRSLFDITVHNGDPRHAIRYNVLANVAPIGGEIIGDGVVLSTPFGSTGYYRSITDSFFEVGIGLAFNNSTEQSDHIVLKEETEIRIKIARGPAIVYADNQPETIELEEGDEMIVRKSKETAKIIRV